MAAARGGFLVVTIDPAGAPAMEEVLQQEGVPLEPCDHAFFRARPRGCTITFYRSGKVMLQGPESERWGVRLGLPAGGGKGERALAFAPDRAAVGSDESGKGDYFGPLVVAAVHADPAGIALLEKAGVRDSKALADRRCTTLAGWIEREFPLALRVVMPADYNRRHRECGGNLNVLLAALHAECLQELLPRLAAGGGGRLVVDRFGPEARVRDALGGLPPGVELVQVPRAEEHPVVAAASILARAEFLEGLKRCSETAARNLPKGCGPAVPRTAAWIREVGGEELLARVAKVHFKV